MTEDRGEGGFDVVPRELTEPAAPEPMRGLIATPVECAGFDPVIGAA
jgi:hypothetical protein